MFDSFRHFFRNLFVFFFDFSLSFAVSFFVFLSILPLRKRGNFIHGGSKALFGPSFLVLAFVGCGREVMSEV